MHYYFKQDRIFTTFGKRYCVFTTTGESSQNELKTDSSKADQFYMLCYTNFVAYPICNRLEVLALFNNLFAPLRLKQSKPSCNFRTRLGFLDL